MTDDATDDGQTVNMDVFDREDNWGDLDETGLWSGPADDDGPADDEECT